jgi:hypothetical protein
LYSDITPTSSSEASLRMDSALEPSLSMIVMAASTISPRVRGRRATCSAGSFAITAQVYHAAAAVLRAGRSAP